MIGMPSSSQLRLVAAADVKHVVSDVGAGNVVGDHGETVGAVGAGSAVDVLLVDKRDGRCRIGGRNFGRGRNCDLGIFSGYSQLKVNDRHGA